MLNRILIALTFLVIATLGFFSYLQPIYLALVCPGCFGFSKADEKIYTESTLNETQKRKILTTIKEGRQTVENTLGPLHISPTIYACTTHECDKLVIRKYPQQTSKAIGNKILLVTQKGINTQHISVHLCQMELKAKYPNNEIPEWFLKASAQVISNPDQPATNNKAISKWYEKAGKEGLLELLKRVKSGQKFSKVYSELGDRP